MLRISHFSEVKRIIYCLGWLWKKVIFLITYQKYCAWCTKIKSRFYWEWSLTIFLNIKTLIKILLTSIPLTDWMKCSFYRSVALQPLIDPSINTAFGIKKPLPLKSLSLFYCNHFHNGSCLGCN